MKSIIATILALSLLSFCTNPQDKGDGFVEFKLIGLVFTNYFVDSLDKTNDAKTPTFFLLIHIANKTKDTLNLQPTLTAELNYFQVPLENARALSVYCHKLCNPLPPNFNGYRSLINKNYAFWLESGYIVAYNDSIIYQNRFEQMYIRSKVTIEMLGYKYEYLLEKNDLIYENDFSFQLIDPDFSKQWKKKLYKNSRFPVERIYMK